MPEGLEAEIWCRSMQPLVGRTLDTVWVDDRVADPAVTIVAPRRPIEAIRRVGKVICVDVGGHQIGLHFGMTGRVIVDGAAPIEALVYSSTRDLAEWDRLRCWTSPAGAGNGEPALRVNDPRRLGRISLDESLEHLGIDIFDVTPQRLARALSGRRRAIKPLLLDQGVVAGLGNLCADEVLWWAGIAPQRSAADLTIDEVGELATSITMQLPKMLAQGGSTTGVLNAEVRAGPAACPRDGTELVRCELGGRTAVWCPAHQR